MLHQKEMPVENPILSPLGPAELKKLILKLRWIGMENEAARLLRQLGRIAPAECAIMGPLETD